jgi:hypothetical protein
MDAYEEEDLNRIGRLDPLLRAAPPAPGSARFEAIREKSMTQTTIRPEPLSRPDTGRQRRHRRLGWSAVAAGAVAAAVTAVVAFGGAGDPATPPPAPAADAPQLLLAAAQQTGQVKTLRFAQAVHGGGAFGATGEIAGADSRVVTTGEGTSSTTTIVGDVRYATSADGETTRKKLSAADKPVPFAEAAADVVRAVTGDAQVETVGTEQVRGQDTTHYRLTLEEQTSAAGPASPLATLPEKTLVWFDWEGLDSYSGAVTVDVWVAGNLIRRIGGAAEGQDPFPVTEFFDFGAPITITAPAGS